MPTIMESVKQMKNCDIQSTRVCQAEFTIWTRLGIVRNPTRTRNSRKRWKYVSKNWFIAYTGKYAYYFLAAPWCAKHSAGENNFIHLKNSFISLTIVPGRNTCWNWKKRIKLKAKLNLPFSKTRGVWTLFILFPQKLDHFKIGYRYSRIIVVSKVKNWIIKQDWMILNLFMQLDSLEGLGARRVLSRLLKYLLAGINKILKKWKSKINQLNNFNKQLIFLMAIWQ